MVDGQWACSDSELCKEVKIQISENWVETKFCYDIWLKHIKLGEYKSVPRSCILTVFL